MFLIFQINYVLAWIANLLCINITCVFVNFSWNIFLHATFQCHESQLMIVSHLFSNCLICLELHIGLFINTGAEVYTAGDSYSKVHRRTVPKAPLLYSTLGIMCP